MDDTQKIKCEGALVLEKMKMVLDENSLREKIESAASVLDSVHRLYSQKALEKLVGESG